MYISIALHFSRPLSVKYNDYFLLLVHSSNNGRSKHSRTFEKPTPPYHQNSAYLKHINISNMDTLVERSNFKLAICKS